MEEAQGLAFLILGAMEDNLPYTNRPGAFHASTIGECLRRQWYEFFNAPTSHRVNLRRIRYGLEFESYLQSIIKRLEVVGYKVESQPVLTSPDFPLLVGTPDAIVLPPKFILEYKHSNYQKISSIQRHGMVIGQDEDGGMVVSGGLDPQDRWLWQCQAYIGLAQSSCALLLVEALSSWGEVHRVISLIPRDEGIIERIKKRLKILEGAVQSKEPPPGTCEKPLNCPFYEVCKKNPFVWKPQE